MDSPLFKIDNDAYVGGYKSNQNPVASDDIRDCSNDSKEMVHISNCNVVPFVSVKTSILI